jgi:hypothetical protein
MLGYACWAEHVGLCSRPVHTGLYILSSVNCTFEVKIKSLNSNLKFIQVNFFVELAQPLDVLKKRRRKAAKADKKNA